MAYELKLPDLGEGLTEGEVARWLVSEGQEVAEDDPLVEIQTDKTTVEIPSPAAGKVTQILVEEGKVVPVGTVLVVIGGDGASELPRGSRLFSSFHTMTGDLSHIYGLANLDALSAKRQRTLPAACKVYDLLNFASEVATHHAGPKQEQSLQAYIGGLISDEYDLENTADQYGDWRDFFVQHEPTTETRAAMSRR